MTLLAFIFNWKMKVNQKKVGIFSVKFVIHVNIFENIFTFSVVLIRVAVELFHIYFSRPLQLTLLVLDIHKKIFSKNIYIFLWNVWGPLPIYPPVILVEYYTLKKRLRHRFITIISILMIGEITIFFSSNFIW